MSGATSNGDQVVEGSEFRLSYKWLSGGLAVILLITLATLVVVAEREGSEALTTVVLALALLSFVLQILFFIVQGTAANQQMMQAQQLYGKTLEALATVSEQTGTTQRAVERLTDHTLGAAIEKGVRQTEIDSELAPGVLAGEDFAQRVAANAVPFLHRASTADGDGATTDTPDLRYPRKQPEPDDAKIVRQLRTFPKGREATLPIIERLEKLAPIDLWILRNYGEDELRNRRPGATLVPGYFATPQPALTEAGYMTEATPRVEQDGVPLIQLTDSGRQAARLLTARGEIPQSLSDTVLPELRERVEEFERRQQERRAERARAQREAEED